MRAAIGLTLPIERIAVTVGGHELQVINTHLGLVPREQRGQVTGLVEDDRGRRLEDVVGHLEGGDTTLMVEPMAQLGVGVVERRETVHEFHRRIAGRL